MKRVFFNLWQDLHNALGNKSCGDVKFGYPGIAQYHVASFS